MKFKKKPVIIEAIQFTEEVALSVLADKQPGPFGLGVSGSWHGPTRKLHSASIGIKTLEGVMRANLGDWIIKGVKGELYPCKPDIFEATYEPHQNED